jgi:hypothetical protein
LSVARELGVAITPALTRTEYLKEQETAGEKKRKALPPNLNRDAGVPIRWKRQMMGVEPLPVARRFRRYVKAQAAEEAEGEVGHGAPGQERKEGWEHVVASCVKAFVGMIYQEQVSLPISMPRTRLGFFDGTLSTYHGSLSFVNGL